MFYPNETTSLIVYSKGTFVSVPTTFDKDLRTKDHPKMLSNEAQEKLKYFYDLDAKIREEVRANLPESHKRKTLII